MFDCDEDELDDEDILIALIKQRNRKLQTRWTYVMQRSVFVVEAAVAVRVEVEQGGV